MTTTNSWSPHRRVPLALLVCFPLLAAVGDQLPKLKATSLNGRVINIPGDHKIVAYVLSFGFSHKCDKAVEAWDKRIAPIYASDPRVGYYEVPVLEGVPGLVKPMILHGMRRTVPAPEQSRFAPVYEGEAALKAIVGFKEPEAAYVVIATSEGKVVWTSHAPASDANFAEMRKAMSEILR